ncbi:MAG: hypothetical protein ACKESB_00555 [Candidatus Hodgkinia cicadicola]
MSMQAELSSFELWKRYGWCHSCSEDCDPKKDVSMARRRWKLQDVVGQVVSLRGRLKRTVCVLHRICEFSYSSLNRIEVERHFCICCSARRVKLGTLNAERDLLCDWTP